VTTINERPLTPKRVIVGALLLGLCVAFLPTWDGLSYYDTMHAAAGTGLVKGARASAGLAKVVIAAGLAVSLARALAGAALSARRRANRSPRRLIFGVGVVVTLVYLGVAAATMTLSRERALHASAGVVLLLVLSGLLSRPPRRSLVQRH
jgi:quinol-cytochrome oxidoreductase complex cytochrome b subunit